jgi:glutamate-ammonia-ligase adenylyltransferase
MSLDFSRSANPAEAEHGFTAFSRAPGAPSASHVDADFLRLFGNSRFLCERLARDPGLYAGWFADPFRHAEKPAAVFHAEARAAALGSDDPDTTAARLKAYKYREYVRLTIRELALENQSEIYREFSHLAYAISSVTAETAFADTCVKYGTTPDEAGDFAIVAMGKLGGRELNYSSDIDVIGLYDGNGAAGSATRHEVFAKTFTKFGKLLQDGDGNGFLYRVDWDLRPEGKTGTLANSLDAMETYYETFGEEWERQAFIKASVLHERADVGRRFLAMMTPFTYRKYLDGKTIVRIRDMKSRIIGELKMKRIDGVNIKLAHGGIRDVEFVVQGLQLLHGGKIPELRVPGTLPALETLASHGLVPADEAKDLKEGYLFLRRLESALQMDDERQTHVLKDDPTEILKAARRLGFTQPADEAVTTFSEQLQRTRDAVYGIFKKFYEP